MPELLKAVHVLPQVRRTASGPAQSVPSLCRALSDCGVDVTLHALAPSYFPAGEPYACREHPSWGVARRLGISPALRRSLRAAAEEAEVMHNHSFWMFPNVYPRRAVLGTGCRLVNSPRGTLSPVALKISRVRKCLAWWLGQGAAARHSALFHATGENEYLDIRRAGLKAPVAVIPNGIELPPASDVASFAGDGPRRLLYLGRLHPIKGLDVLLRSWRDVEAAFPDWELDLVGPDDGAHRGRLERLARELGIARLRFSGPAYGAAKSAAYRAADLYVLPSRSESFAITVAEALAHGLPVITTRATPWPGLSTHGCGWWIEGETGALGECLRQALAMDRAELARCGARGREWMRRDFAWPRIGERMRETYLWLLGGGPAPDWVRCD